jgi:hypothetical protein
MGGTNATQGQRDQKVQALTFHQVSPRFLKVSRPFNSKMEPTLAVKTLMTQAFGMRECALRINRVEL